MSYWQPAQHLTPSTQELSAGLERFIHLSATFSLRMVAHVITYDTRLSVLMPLLRHLNFLVVVLVR